MESSLQKIEPNALHSLIIGCEQYTGRDALGAKFKIPISKSYDDVKRYKEFLTVQEFDSIHEFTDEKNFMATKLHQKITDKLGEMYQLSGMKAKNPWKVNFITFSGHGITFEGDAIGIITEYDG